MISFIEKTILNQFAIFISYLFLLLWQAVSTSTNLGPAKFVTLWNDPHGYFVGTL